jgi:hypothetical protein
VDRLAAGALFAFSPIRTDQVAHLSTLGTQWWPLVLLFTIRFAKRGRPADALVAALAFVLAFLACGYHGVIAAAVLPPFLAVLFWGRWQRLKWGAIAAVLAGLALLPLYRMHQKALEPERYARGTSETIQYSAPLESFLATSSWNRLYGEATDAFRAEGPNNLFPGLVVPRWSWPARSCCGGGASGRPARPGRSRRSSRRPRSSHSAHGFAASGPTSARALGAPAATSCRFPDDPRHEPGLASSSRCRSRCLPRCARDAEAGRAALALVGLLRARRDADRPDPDAGVEQGRRHAREPPPAYRWLAEQPGRDPVVHLPMLDVYGLERRPAFHESIYMVYSTLHWKPLVNGYAGIEPKGYVQLRELLRAFPSEPSLAALRAAGTRWIVVHRKGFGPLQWERLQSGMPQALGGSLRRRRCSATTSSTSCCQVVRFIEIVGRGC